MPHSELKMHGIHIVLPMLVLLCGVCAQGLNVLSYNHMYKDYIYVYDATVATFTETRSWCRSMDGKCHPF